MNKHRAMTGGGRPSKYRPEYCDLIIDFFDKPPFEKSTREGDVAKMLPSPIRFLFQFAKSIGVHEVTLERWAKKYPEFCRALSRAKKIQAAMLAEGAALGVYNPLAARFILKNIAGWKDKEKAGQGEEKSALDRAVKDWNEIRKAPQK